MFRAQTGGASGFVKEVVIKRILPSFNGDRNFVRMFVDEARIAARLHHPNIVQVFDFDVVDGQYYIAMEYVEGVDLRTLLETASQRGQPLNIPVCLFIVKEVAKALDYAHRRRHKGKPLNIIHRDVSPHNVMLSFSGSVKLTDFGIAKASSRATRTQEGIVKGKTSYMSPEQAAGHALDPRSDLFALGTLFYELVTMRRLFIGETEREILLKVINADVPSPRSTRRDLPASVEKVIMTLLAKKRERRYDGAASLLKALGRLYRELAEAPAEFSLQERLQSLFPDRVRQDSVLEDSSWPDPELFDAPGGTPIREARELRGGTEVQVHDTHVDIETRVTDPIQVPVAEAQVGASVGARNPSPTVPMDQPPTDTPPPPAPPPPVRTETPFKRQSVVSGKDQELGPVGFEKGTQLYGADDAATVITRSPIDRPRSFPYWLLVVVVVLALILGLVLVWLLDPLGLGAPAP